MLIRNKKEKYSLFFVLKSQYIERPSELLANTSDDECIFVRSRSRANER